MFKFFKKDKKEETFNEKVESELEIDEKDQEIILEADTSEPGAIDESEIDEEISDVDDTEAIGFFEKLRKSLTKTRENMSNKFNELFTKNVEIDEELYEQLEEILITSDIGFESTEIIIEKLRGAITKNRVKNSSEIYPLLKTVMSEMLETHNINNELNVEDHKPTVILIIGVNGVGKTTTIGKLAYKLKNDGKKVTVAAADTFRAAAIDQLKEWTDRAGVNLVSHKEGSDPSAVIFDAIQSARSKTSDILICDTAGRLHNKVNLMKELEKINKTINTHYPNSNKEILLVLDATTGQNAMNQLREFKNVCDITGIILTKLDGSAKGGIIFPLQYELNVPVKFVGLGETIDSLEKFDSKKFVDCLFE